MQNKSTNFKNNIKRLFHSFQFKIKINGRVPRCDISTLTAIFRGGGGRRKHFFHGAGHSGFFQGCQNDFPQAAKNSEI